MGKSPTVSPDKLILQHKKADGTWKKLATTRDIVEKKICGEVDSLSLFGLFELDIFGLISGF
jgi:hypothetical protein